MSRSQAFKKQLPNGDHLACIINVAKVNNEILITFADGKNNQLQKIYDFNSSEFIKLCHAAGTINKGEVFNSLDCIGQTLWITVANDNITDTCAHIEGVDHIFKNNMDIMSKGVELNVTVSQIEQYANTEVDLEEYKKKLGAIDETGHFDSPIENACNDAIEQIREKMVSKNGIAVRKSELTAEDKAIIKEAREMIKNVESGTKVAPAENDDDSM